MDTKWRKWKIIVSFTAFFVGMSLLIMNFWSMVSLLAASDWETIQELTSKDYQDSAQFRWIIASRLEDLLGVAAGGNGWDGYEVATEEGDTYYNDSGFMEYWLWQTDTTEVIEEDTAATEGLPDAASEEETAAQTDTPELENFQERREAYMENLAGDRNLLYAVIQGDSLLYTNIEGLEERIGDGIGASGVANQIKDLDLKEYNFSLWFNKERDSRVEITKDGKPVEVYGDGVYTEDSDWYVPGYSNFKAGDAADNIVIYLAAAKSPKLYVTGNYSKSGTIQRGGQLYYLKENQKVYRSRYQKGLTGSLAALLLLILAWFLREGKRRADRWLAGLLGRIWLEAKLLFLVLVPAVTALIVGKKLFAELFWILGNDLYVVEEIAYIGNEILKNGMWQTACFWLFYLAVLDLRRNKDRQKSLWKNLCALLRIRNLMLPMQQRLVKRQNWILLSTILLVLWLFFGILLLACLGLSVSRGGFLMLEGGLILSILLLELSFWSARKARGLAEDFGALDSQIERMREGNLKEDLELSEASDLKQTAENLNQIRQGMEYAIAEQTKSERMKVELVANVSHDIKTPLTSIVSYVELLKQEEDLPQYVKEYIQILGEKSERLKEMVQDVFEVSKAASGQLPVEMEELDFGKLLRQTLADMDAAIVQSGLTFRTAIPEEPILIRADGQRMYRVFQNLMQNALQYSLAGSRVYLTLRTESGKAEAVIKNTSAVELASSVDFTERFVRGDESRTDGGSGLGLSIAKSFTEACGGQLQVETNADLFIVTVIFEVIKE